MGKLLSMRLVMQATALLGVGMTFFVCQYLADAWTPEGLHFPTARALREFAVSRGLIAHCGRGSGEFWGPFYLADHPVTLADLQPVGTRRDCGLTPAWRGILWVSDVRNEITTVFPESLGGKWRVWGNVVVAGDEDLMDRIEALSRNQ
jgi:hypothetical protein